MPPYVEYLLTPPGIEINKPVGSPTDRIDSNMPKIAKAQQKYLT